jgi:hypothetical protein
LHPRKSVISRVDDGVRFLGYRVFPDHRRLASENVIRMKRRLRWLQRGFAHGEVSAAGVRHRVTSWIGHARHADTYRLRRRLLGAISFSRKVVKPSGAAVEPSCGAGRLLEQ